MLLPNPTEQEGRTAARAPVGVPGLLISQGLSAVPSTEQPSVLTSKKRHASLSAAIRAQSHLPGA